MSTATMTDPKVSVIPLLEGSTWPLADIALRTAASLPIPTSKTEAWRYTRVSKLFGKRYSAPNGSVPITLPERLPFDALRVVLVNGHLREDLSDSLTTQTGLIIDKLSNRLGDDPVQADYGTLAVTDDRLFIAMNTANPTDGIMLRVSKGIKSKKPVHVLHILAGEDQLVQPRDLILLQEDAEAEVIIEYVSLSLNPTSTLVNSVRECFVGTGARLTMHKLQNSVNCPTLIEADHFDLLTKAWLSIDTITLDGSLIRNDLNVALSGPEAHAELNGVYVLNGNTHCDNHTYIGHDVPDCTSDELYKGIIAEKGTGVFNGKVYVKQDAQRTRAYQSNANILQGDDARIFTKPELEIYADDVKCSHGCTIGRLDEKGLFYLRSRGVSEAEARRMLSHAFMTDVLERITNEDWRKHLAALIGAKLETL